MKTNRLTINLILVILSMLCLTYASVPLYNLFCKTTGFAGTTMRYDKNKHDIKQDSEAPYIIVRFNADTRKELDWTFETKQKFIRLRPGEPRMAFYHVKNHSDEDITGMAIYNVTPFSTAKYFLKIECFCFQEQTLKAGEEALMPVLLMLDPKIQTDPFTKNIDTITLSYTFFKFEE